MASAETGAENPTSYYAAPASEPSPAESTDQRDDTWSWDTSDWRRGDRWANGRWYRPYDYDYYNHWSWGSRAEWGSNSFESFHGSHGEGDDDQGSGTRFTSRRAMRARHGATEGVHGTLQGLGLGNPLRGQLRVRSLRVKRLLGTRVPSARRWRFQVLMLAARGMTWA